MNCQSCAYYHEPTTGDALGSGTCHAEPPKVFIVRNKPVSYYPEILADDPACQRWKLIEPKSWSGSHFGFGITSGLAKFQPEFAIESEGGEA